MMPLVFRVYHYPVVILFHVDCFSRDREIKRSDDDPVGHDMFKNGGKRTLRYSSSFCPTPKALA